MEGEPYGPALHHRPPGGLVPGLDLGRAGSLEVNVLSRAICCELMRTAAGRVSIGLLSHAGEPICSDAGRGRHTTGGGSSEVCLVCSEVVCRPLLVPPKARRAAKGRDSLKIDSGRPPGRTGRSCSSSMQTTDTPLQTTIFICRRRRQQFTRAASPPIHLHNRRISRRTSSPKSKAWGGSGGGLAVNALGSTRWSNLAA